MSICGIENDNEQVCVNEGCADRRRNRVGTGIDAGLRARGVSSATLPDGVSEDALRLTAADAVLLLVCYTPITARVIDAAAKLKGIVKYGVGVDSIDIPAAVRRGTPVVNVPEYAEETVAEGAFRD